MSKLLAAPYTVVRMIRSARKMLKLLSLRLRGVRVHWTAVIDPAAIFEPSGGKITIGARTFIDRGVIFRPLGGWILLGDDCSVNAYSVLYGSGGLEIGNDVRIAAHTVIVPSNHKFSDPCNSIKNQGLTLKGIVIEDDVWIGSGARVLDGVRIGQGSVIGAGSVVTKSTAANSVNVGVPARCIRLRTKETPMYTDQI